MAEPAEETNEPKTLEDYDKAFKYNPNWQKMSKADRKLLLDFAKMTPEEIGEANVDFTKVSTDMKVTMALKLSNSWPGETLNAAQDAFTDPLFVIMLVVTMGIYVGLWLTPEPTFVTKLAAGTLTVVMLTQFAWEDIVGTAKAWFLLNDECKQATTVNQLKAAGDKFAIKVGSVGFDILMFIATWGLGKAAGPKLSKIGAQRGVVRAEAGLRSAEARAGSGRVQNIGLEKAKVPLDLAKAKSQGTTATQVLNALAESLPESTAKEGLAKFRSKVNGGDAQVLKSLENMAKSGKDISKFLSDQGVSAEVKAQAQAKLLEAETKFARAKLIEAEAIKDPSLRKMARQEQLNNAVERMKLRLQEMGLLDDAKIKQAANSRNLNTLISEIGELLQRSRLRAKYPANKGYRLLSNLAIVREIKGFNSIEGWKSAARSKALTENPKIDKTMLEKELSRNAAKLFEQNGRLYESLGELDSLVTEPNANGKLRPVEANEVKTGAGDKALEAQNQLTKAVNALKQVAAGNSDVKVFDRVGKNQIGKEITSDFDFSQLDAVKQSTVGPEGKGFTESLGYDVEVLQSLAESLVKNLPPANPQTIPPMTSPERKSEE